MDAFVYYCFQNGETWAIGSFTLTGKNPERPIYKTTNINTWPSKLKNWKYYNLNKRGGMWIPADKEFQPKTHCGLVKPFCHALQFKCRLCHFDHEIPSSTPITYEKRFLHNGGTILHTIFAYNIGTVFLKSQDPITT